MTLPLKKKLHIHYPSSDGKPMADNTRQWNWITFIKNGLEATTAGQNIFIAGDLFWYPVQGNNKIRVAPDVMVAIGRPKGDRNSYLQWKETNIAPQIVFEILSPSNSKKEMKNKLAFYEKYEVQEYYVYDPDFHQLEVYYKEKDKLVKQEVNDWTSPLLGFRMFFTDEKLDFFHPNGSPFLSYAETLEQAKSSKAIAIKAERKADDAERKAAILAAKLKELGIDPDSLV